MREVSRRTIMQLAAGGFLFRGDSGAADPKPPATAETPPQPCRAKVRTHGGIPTVFIDEKARGPMFYTPGGRDAWERPEIARRGFEVLFEFVHQVGWPGEQEETFRILDERMRRWTS